MDPEDKRALDKVLELTEENNKILRQIRGSQKNAKMFRAIYWVVIIAITVGSYYLVKPYIDTVKGLYSDFGGTMNISGLPSASQMQNMVIQLKAKQ